MLELAADFAGVAGGLFAHYLSYLNPNSFTFIKSIEVIAMIVLGGLGSISGAILGAVTLTLLPEVLRPVKDYRMVIYSLMLIVLMITRPQGLLGSRELDLTTADLHAYVSGRDLIDILVDNAGIIRRAPAEVTADDWGDVLTLTLDATFRPADDRPGPREDHRHRVDAVLPGWCPGARKHAIPEGLFSSPPAPVLS